jgi:hypothetical protein
MHNPSCRAANFYCRPSRAIIVSITFVIEVIFNNIPPGCPVDSRTRIRDSALASVAALLTLERKLLSYGAAKLDGRNGHQATGFDLFVHRERIRGAPRFDNVKYQL